jgi:hypothetical protein
MIRLIGLQMVTTNQSTFRPKWHDNKCQATKYYGQYESPVKFHAVLQWRPNVRKLYLIVY